MEAGHPVQVMRRENRHGFKAGGLVHGLNRVEGQGARRALPVSLACAPAAALRLLVWLGLASLWLACLWPPHVRWPAPQPRPPTVYLLNPKFALQIPLFSKQHNK